jgi:anti-sigma B factor antagonist
MSEVGFAVEMVSGVPIVAAPEEIDITNADQLRAALLRAADDGEGTFVVDLSRTRFCDSAGLHALVDAHKRAQGQGRQLLLAVSGEAVLRIFELTGVDRVLLHFPSVAEALAYLPTAGAPGGPGA